MSVATSFMPVSPKPLPRSPPGPASRMKEATQRAPEEVWLQSPKLIASLSKLLKHSKAQWGNGKDSPRRPALSERRTTADKQSELTPLPGGFFTVTNQRQCGIPFERSRLACFLYQKATATAPSNIDGFAVADWTWEADHERHVFRSPVFNVEEGGATPASCDMCVIVYAVWLSNSSFEAGNQGHAGGPESVQRQILGVLPSGTSGKTEVVSPVSEVRTLRTADTSPPQQKSPPRTALEAPPALSLADESADAAARDHIARLSEQVAYLKSYINRLSNSEERELRIREYEILKAELVRAQLGSSDAAEAPARPSPRRDDKRNDHLPVKGAPLGVHVGGATPHPPSMSLSDEKNSVGLTTSTAGTFNRGSTNIPGVTDMQWRFTQSFGDDNSSDDDLVTAMQFDPTGTCLAVGDKAGRICVFEGFQPETGARQQFMDYRFYTEFQSHEPEFDCLKSLEIEEKINVIRWCDFPSAGRFILSANDKTIKLWKLHEKRVYPGVDHPQSEAAVYIPPPREAQLLKTATRKRVFGNAHQYHINSLSQNSDMETFISADDLRINLWHLNDTRETFNIVDIKPADLKELNEVITTASFQPTSCNVLMYATSRGNIRLLDTREQALCERHYKQFENEALNPGNHFFTEIIGSISDAKFSGDGRYIISRDYLTLKVWDINMDTQPVAVIPVHDYLTPYLPELYDNDCIFDKFTCHANARGTRFITGSYNNNFMVHDMSTSSSVTIEAKDDPRDGTAVVENPNVDLMDFAKKALHVAWHPEEEVLAVAGMNKIYVYQAANGARRGQRLAR